MSIDDLDQFQVAETLVKSGLITFSWLADMEPAG
jgi:hypothetical protein